MYANYLDCNEEGSIDLLQLDSLIRRDTILIAAMWINNETGVQHDIKKIAKLAHQNKVPFFSDLTQGVGKLPIQLREFPIAAAAFSGHKIGGPKGIGGLYISRKDPRVQMGALTFGGNQENGIRPGTLNIPGIVGLAKATEQSRKEKLENIFALNDLLRSFFRSKGCKINGSYESNSPFILSITAPEGCFARDLFKKNPNIAFSLGSACTSASLKNSHVLLGMGRSDTEAARSFRISINWSTAPAEVDFFIQNFQL